jgi:hypothetical protein
MLGGPTAGAIGGRIGGFLGNAAGGLAHFVGKLFGSGDYHMPLGEKIRNNSLLLPMGLAEATFARDNLTDATPWVYRQYLGDVTSSVGYAATTFELSPMQLGLLTQLQAQIFQEWEPCGIVFQFITESSDYSAAATTALGCVGFVTQYNASAVAPNSKYEALEYEFSQSHKPSVNQVHPIECAREQTNVPLLFTEQSGGVPAGEDKRLYRLGRTTVFTQGQQAAGTKMGEIWVTMHLNFRKQWVPPAVTSGSILHAALAVDTNNPIGPAAAIAAGTLLNTFGTSIVLDYSVAGTARITFPRSLGRARRYQVRYDVAIAGNAGGWTPTIVTSASISAPAIEPTVAGAEVGSGLLFPAGGTGLAPFFSWVNIVDVAADTAVVPTLTWTNGFGPGGAGYCGVWVIELPLLAVM